MDSLQQSLERARLGDTTAIAQLLNHSLQSKGMTARVTRQGGCLRVLLEAEQIPPQQALVPYLQKNLEKLKIASVHTVELMGKQAYAAVPAWKETIKLNAQPATPAAPVAPSPPSPPPVPFSSQGTVDRPANPHQTKPTYQIVFTGVIALTLILIGANLRSVHTLFTKPHTTRQLSLSSTKDGFYRAPIISRRSGVPVIMVTFNGNLPFPMIVDTGAGGTLITPAMAAALAVTPIGQATAQTANGSATFNVGYVNSIEVDGARIDRVPVAIGRSDMDVGLLGHDFFDNFDVVVRETTVEFYPRQSKSDPSS
jgi:predicted aspartyl protease